MTPGQSPLIGESRAMRELRALVAAVAPTPLAVLIEGPTGAGKELVALALHQQSGRDGALVTFNVCAVSESMFEDALFGHARGAFTGAANETLGFLREANGGTAFLDEISGLPLALQAKLLRAVETGVFRPVGASRDAHSSFRPLAATNERLDLLVDAGRFRADLAHRLSGVVIAVPPLAARADDIPLLVEHFVNHAGRASATVAAGAVRRLSAHTWPGNVRELRQVIDAALIFARGVLDEDAVERALSQRARAAAALPDASLADRQALVDALERASWDADEAARMMGVHRATLYRRMKRLAVRGPRHTATVAPSRTVSLGGSASRATPGV